MRSRGTSFQLVQSLSLFRPHAAFKRIRLFRCPSLSLACPDNLRTNLVPLSPPLQGDKADGVGSVLLKTPQPCPARTRNLFEIGCHSVCQSLVAFERERFPMLGQNDSLNSESPTNAFL